MSLEIINKKIAEQYTPENDFPCLFKQHLEFQLTKPFAGIKILHATPIFMNTLPKLLPLLASGASLTITPPPNLPFDPNIINLLREAGVCVEMLADPKESYDIILDCAGLHAHIPTRYGAVELTQSGESIYNTLKQICISVDSSPIKLIEDLLGTSEGLLRALNQESISINGADVTLFGFGKVGKGIYLRLKPLCKSINVVEKNLHVSNPWKTPLIPLGNTETIKSTVANSDIVIMATGATATMATIGPACFTRKQTLINMGASDEFGDWLPTSRVFNNKAPANFILSEPTRLRYLDSTFALHNQSAIDLTKSKLDHGVNTVRRETEQALMQEIKKKDLLWKELCEFKLDTYFY